MFRTVKSKPINYNELRQMYVGMIKNITCNDIINSKRGTTRGNQLIVYELDNKIIQYHVALNKYTNSCGHNFDDVVVKRFNINQSETLPTTDDNDILFLDDV